MAAQATTNNALNADATKVEAFVPATKEARIALTLVQAAVASASRVDSIMVAEAAADNAIGRARRLVVRWRNR